MWQLTLTLCPSGPSCFTCSRQPAAKKPLKRPSAAAREEERRKRLKLTEGGADTSDEEAEYEKAPRLSAWDPDDKKKGVHFLLPLKASKGKLIQQEPMQLANEGLSLVPHTVAFLIDS